MRGRRVAAASHRLRLAGVAVIAFCIAAGWVPALPATAAGAGTSSAAYVALGDSFTAGPWVPNQLPESGGCHRSDHNYPHLVAQALGLALGDVSCSGADTADMTSAQDVWPAPNPPQLDALGPDTAVVTLGIGGNDIGFGSIVSNCATIAPWRTPCQDRYVVNGNDELSRRIAETGPKVAAVLDEIHRRSPGARVFVVGYPAIVPDTGFGCWPVLPYAYADVPYLRAKHKELNAMLAARAAADGSAYVDVYTPSIGHDACRLPGHRWVEAVVPLAPAAPLHPNALGMSAMATVVTTSMRAAGVPVPA